MIKEELCQRLSKAIGKQINRSEFSKFVSCFSEHARYMARFFGKSESDVRPPAVLRGAHEFTCIELELFCKYCGYDLTQEDAPPLW